MATSLERSQNEYQINIYTNMSINPEKLVKIALEGSEISLVQAIVNKER